MAEQKAIFRASNLQAGDLVGTLRLLSTHFVGRRRMWVCQCETCGTSRTIRLDHLDRYAGKPCKCVPNRTHGLSQTREYAIWSKMLWRCYEPTSDNYRFYGALGHYVCQRWRESPQAFLDDMGTAPSSAHTLDRIDTLGHYTCGKCEECSSKNQPANCRWATKAEQVRNMKNNLVYTHDGKTLILKDWARLIGMNYRTLYYRLLRGWTFIDAISTPTRPLRAGRPSARRKPS